MKKHLFLLLALVCCTASTAWAGFSNPVIRIDHEPTTLAATLAKIAADNQGHVYAVWEDERSDAGVYFNYSHDNGNTWQGTDTFIELTGSSYQKDLKILADDSGHVYLTWIAIVNGGYNLAFAYSHDYGQSFSTQLINIGEVGWSIRDVDMDIDGAGNVCLVGSEGNSFPHNLYSTCSNDYGATWSSSIKINTNNPVSSQTQRDIKICMDNSGHYYTAWIDGRDGTSGGWKHMYFNYSHDYGQSWGQEKRIEPSGFAKNASSHNIDCDNNGNVHVIWHSSDGQNGNSNIYYNYSSDHGVTWPTRQAFSTSGHAPQVQSGKNGHVYTTWLDTSNSPYHTIRFKQSTDYGQTFNSEVLINGSHDTQNVNYILKARNNFAAIAWENVEPYEGIFIDYSEDGGSTWLADDIQLDNGVNTDRPHMDISASGDMYAVWEDDYNYSEDIYFKSGSTDGLVSIFQNFESNNGSDQYGWGFVNDTVSLSSEQVHSGSQAWKVVSAAQFGGTGLQSQTQRWDMDLKPDLNDRLTLWVWAQPDNGGNNTLLVKFYDTNLYSTGFDVWTTQAAQYQQWTQLDILFSQLPDDFDLNHINKLELINFDSGTYYYDDIEVALKDRTYQTFENCADATDCGWAWGGTIAIEEDYVYEGEASWKLLATENWAGTGLRSQTKKYDAINDEQTYWNVDLNPTENDQLTFWVYNMADNGLANNLAVQLFDHDEHFTDPVVYWTTQRAFHGQWTKLSVPFSELPSTLDLDNLNKIQFQVFWPGTYYFDDIRASKQALSIDQVELLNGNVTWNEHSEAYSYEVEQSLTGTFGSWETIFDGTSSQFSIDEVSPRFLRIRWKEQTSYLSPNRYQSDWQSPIVYQPRGVVIDYDALAQGDITFTTMPQANRYQIETSVDKNGPWTLEYDGVATILLQQAVDDQYYRVRAIKDENGVIVDQSEWSPAISYHPDQFVKATGLTLKELNGLGDAITLRGINLGNVFLIEPEFTGIGGKFTPLDLNDDDDYGIREELINRFSSDDILDDFQDAYITEIDFDHIMRTKANLVRLPIYYRVVEDINGNFTQFDKIDEIISQSSSRGLYVLLDLHGAPGAQSVEHHAGRMNYNKLFEDSTLGEDYRAKTVEFWQAVALRYKDHPMVVGYDILNEPFGAEEHDPTYIADNGLWTLYDDIYQAIRLIDPKHMIVMESIPSQYDWDTLPDPDDYNWTNVLYQFHYYCFLFDEYGEIDGTCDTAGHQSFLNDKVVNSKQTQYNVPVLIGEFNGFDHSDNWNTHMQYYSNMNWSWAMWSYKTHPTLANWGIFVHDIDAADLPNVNTDSETTLQDKFAKYTTVANHVQDTTLTALLTQYIKPETTSIKVTINPQAAINDGAQWRLRQGPDTSWKDSGDTITDLPPGKYTIKFKRIRGFIKPVNQKVTVVDGPIEATGTYTVQAPGTVKVTIDPAAASAVGAKWRLTRGPDTSWKDSGDIVTVPTGRYRIRFKKVAGYTKPCTIHILVGEGEDIEKTGSYMVH